MGEVAADPLHALYPHLGDGASVRDEPDLVESVRRKVDDHRSVVDDFFAGETPAVAAAARTLAETYRMGGRLLLMGNGGSSCDAAHVAVEFLHPVTAGRPALTAINLTADVAMISAVGNDLGFAHVFVRQLLAHGRRGDCLMGLSTSGNSANLVAAFQKAREMGVSTVGVAGGNGGEMARLGLDHCLVVDTDSVHRVQECHVVIYHVLWDLVHTLLAGDRRPPGGAA